MHSASVSIRAISITINFSNRPLKIKMLKDFFEILKINQNENVGGVRTISII